MLLRGYLVNPEVQSSRSDFPIKFTNKRMQVANFDRVVEIMPVLHIGQPASPEGHHAQENLIFKLCIQDGTVSIEQHNHSSTADAFPRVNDESEEDTGWGLRSWYDLGDSRTPDTFVYGHRDMDDELMWFKQRAIRESVGTRYF